MVADNPASILIALGFVSIFVAIFTPFLIPISFGVQVLLGVLGFFMMLVGILVHILWLQH